ncbi:cytochrome P450 [Amycolatopsis anabasis]|uniref:cytochrome P450 n=1 Tax=Amycolatopsis anabasis TaxID=1840409 RepID=UPI00131C856C|nr:cytochrome P450 [Amycolatopsis anabasis]
MTQAPAIAAVDLTNPHTFVDSDLTEFWRHLRAETPVYRHPETERGPAFWVLSKHADFLAVCRDTKRFSSERGNVLDTLLLGADTAGGKMLVVSDPPHHAKLRKLLLKTFTPRALQVIVDRLRVVTDELVAEAVAKGECDIAADVAAHVPLATICDLLDVPRQDRAEILRLTKSTISSENPDHTAMDGWMAKNDLLLYFADLAEQRRDTPHADVVSLLATAEVDGAPLPSNEVVLNCYNLILGGDETTRLAMVGAVQAFLDHPAQWERLRRGEVELDTAVEEILRWTSPAMHFGRTAKQDLELNGQPIKAGEIVTVWSVSANRDEEIFDAPDVFDLGRTPNNHVTFGYGPHFCIGAYLARVEVKALLEGLLAHVGAIDPRGPSRRIYSTCLVGLSSLPVTLRQTAAHG